MELELIAITEDEAPSVGVPAIADEVIKAYRQLYGSVGYEPPWIGYLALENGSCVGTCGFKSPPQGNRVEIAYFTFPGHESRGVATEMAAELISRARASSPEVTVAAQTLPKESASTSILKKLRFQFIETVDHPEDGHVWEWHLA